MKAVSRLRLLVALGAVTAACAVPQVAQGATALEGCMVAKQNTLCTATGGDGGLNWSSSRSAAYSSAEGYFQYHGIGPWTIQYESGTITCPKATLCEKFFPVVLVSLDSQLLLSQTGNGTVFAGALDTSGGGD
jgi:hypothetical protein